MSEISSEYERVFCYKCPKCEFVSLEKTTIACHLNEQHNDSWNETQQIVNDSNLKQKKISYKCNFQECNVTLIQQDNIVYHRKCHHSDNEFKCPECGETFARWRLVSLHLWKSHAIDMELYSCTLCDYKSSKSELLKFHINTHSDDRSFLCDMCGKGFKNMKQLRNHKELHSADLSIRPHYSCDVCGKSLSNSRLLRAHKNAIHLKARAYLCNFCGHNTTSQSSLRIHLRQHTGEKPFSCSECNYCTADHNSLRRHRMKHSGEKKYKCPHCDYASIQSSTFKAHLNSKHPELSEQLIFSCKLCTFKTVREQSLELHHSSTHDIVQS